MLAMFRAMLRSRVGVVIGLLFLALVALAFAAADLSSMTGNMFASGSTVAKADGKELPATEVQDRVQRVFDSNRRDNPGLTMQTFFAGGGFENVLQQLIDGITLRAFADNQGMAVSKKLIDADIARNPAFHDATGKFSQRNFETLLQSQRIREAALRDDIADQILRRQVLLPAAAGARAPDAMSTRYAAILLEQRRGTFAAIPSEAFMSEAPVTPAQLSAYYQANADQFSRPEQRAVRYIIVDRADLSARTTPTEAAIAKYYRENAATYGATTTRALKRLVMPSEAAARDLAAKAKAGGSLEALAQQAGLATTTLDATTQQALAKDIGGPATQQVFAAKLNDVVGPVRTELGWTVYQVSDIRSVAGRTLDQVRGEISTALKEQQSRQALADLANKLDEAAADGATFDEIASSNGLKGETTPLLTSEPRDLAKPDQPVAPELAPVVKAAFAMDQDDDPQIVQIVPDESFALVAVARVQAAGPPPLQAIRADVERSYRLSEAAKRAKAAAAQIEARAKKGMALAEAVKQAGVALPQVSSIATVRGELGRDGGPVPAPLVALFSMKRGTVRTVPIEGERGYMVVHLDGITPGDATGKTDLVNNTRDALANVLGGEYADQFMRAIAKDVGVSRDEAAVARVRSDLLGTGGAQ